jgi:hypothetical protein
MVNFKRFSLLGTAGKPNHQSKKRSGKEFSVPKKPPKIHLAKDQRGCTN